jgi:diaminopimelate epimerase
MRSSRWHAHGNVYLVTEPCGLTADRVRELVGDADGILEVADDGQVTIWNPDGSQAEMSGNGTRIAARWLSERSGEDVVTVRVGERAVVARMLGGDEVEQELGEVRVGESETVDGVKLIPVDVGNPHAVVLGDPAELPVLGPKLETHQRFPGRTNVQVARIDAPGEVTARVWERGVGETSASGTSAVAVAAATHPDGGEVVVHFPGGDLLVRLEGGRAYLRGPAAPVDESAQDRHEDPQSRPLA